MLRKFAAKKREEKIVMVVDTFLELSRLEILEELPKSVALLIAEFTIPKSPSHL